MTKDRISTSLLNAEAGCREPFVDVALYDYEYRRRRADIHFYRHLAQNRVAFAPGPVLDLACGSGRLLVPLLRDGHEVIGLDRSADMLAAAQRRVRRLSPSRAKRCTLVRADLRAFALRRPAGMAISAFHSVQHLLSDDDLRRFLRSARASLVQGGWLLFDVLAPDPAWIGRDPKRRWGRTTFRHPATRQRFVYTTNHRFDPKTRLLHMRLYYQPIDEKGQPCGREHVVRLCHRQLWPEDVDRLLKGAGFRPLETFAGFDGSLLDEPAQASVEHVYLAAAT
jgi:SAM-dependent methyltransferase